MEKYSSLLRNAATRKMNLNICFFLSCRMQLKSESRSKQKGRVAAQHLPAKSPGQTARRWTRTHRGTRHPTAQERTQQAQTPAHHTGISSQKEGNGTLILQCAFLFYWVLPDAVSAQFWMCGGTMGFHCQLWRFCWTLNCLGVRGGAAGSAIFNKHIIRNVCCEEVFEFFFFWGHY